MKFQHLLQQTETILQDMGFGIKITPLEADFVEIVLLSDKGKKVRSAGHIQLGPSQDDLYLATNRLRSTEPTTVNTMNVFSFLVEKKFRNRGLARLLLIYGLCYFKDLYPEIDYSVLDDASDGSTMMTGNVYAPLGYEPLDHVCLSNTDRRRVEPSSPTKVLALDESFVAKAREYLNKF